MKTQPIIKIKHKFSVKFTALESKDWEWTHFIYFPLLKMRHNLVPLSYTMDPESQNAKSTSIFGWTKKMVRDIKNRDATPEELAKRAYERSNKAQNEYKQSVTLNQKFDL